MLCNIYYSHVAVIVAKPRLLLVKYKANQFSSVLAIKFDKDQYTLTEQSSILLRVYFLHAVDYWV